jgi:hypothetical protein
MRRLLLLLALLIAPVAARAQAQYLPGACSLSGCTFTGQVTLPSVTQWSVSADPSATNTGPGSSGLYRWIMNQTTLTYSASSTNIWEGNSDFVTVAGPGVAEGEINVRHSLITVNDGATIDFAEDYEANVLNDGAIASAGTVQLNGFLHNQSKGTVTSDFVVKGSLENDNTTSGSVAIFAALDMEAETGGGSVPTYYYVVRNAEPNASLSTLGGIGIGTLAVESPGVLFINVTNGNSPISIYNGATREMNVDPSGNLNIAGTYSVGAATGVTSTTCTQWTGGLCTHS